MTNETKVKLPVDLKRALQVAQRAAREGRALLDSYWGKLEHVKVKERAGIVSEADVESEKLINRILGEFDANIPVLGEEGTYLGESTARQAQKSRTRWIVDPLDGTTNYVHSFPIYAISIGLQVNNEMVLGLVDVPRLDQTFYAFKGGGAYCNAVPIVVSQRLQLSECLLATGFYGDDPETIVAQVRVFERMLKKTRGIRRAGSAAFDLCMVASGVFDAYWESNLQSWDTAGGVVIVREAGGVVTDYAGQDFDPEFKTLLASNKHMHETVRSHLTPL